MPQFKDIPQLTQHPPYSVDIGWRHVASWIAESEPHGVDLDPDFQRDHVWTQQHQIAYVEYVLRGGASGKTIYFNQANYPSAEMLVLVDGKQRLEAVRSFINNELPIFGRNFYRDYTDAFPLDARFNVKINTLNTRAAVLQWYLELNTTGVPHTNFDLARVELMLIKERETENA